MVHLEKNTQSDYGHMYSGTKSKVVKGHYLNYEKTTREGLLYKKGREEAIIPQECVLYCGICLQQSKKQTDIYELQKENHEDIMCTIGL